MRLALLLLPVLLSTACRTCPDCVKATLPAEPVSPTPIVTVAPSLPCSLPPRPQKYEHVGMASPDGIVVTKSDLAGLVVWLEAMNAWAAGAAVCLESRR